MNEFTRLSWDADHVQKLVSKSQTTKERTQTIFYAILEQGAETMNGQFRYLLKAIATAAGHLDQLKKAILDEMSRGETTLAEKLMQEQLVEFSFQT